MRALVANQFEYEKGTEEIICLFHKAGKIKKVWNTILSCSPALWLILFALLTVTVNVLGRTPN
jgi:hypothetical protein